MKKELLYQSTRGKAEKVPSSIAVLQGLAPDGGLYVPERIPVPDVPLEELAALDYPQLARRILSLYLTDYTSEEIDRCVAGAYDEKFDIPEITVLKEAAGVHYLELFHGATIAFKDMALSILPHLMTTAAKKNQLGKEIVILTATSGDTGKAALAGFADVPGTRIIVFYPKHGVSPVQERQMVTQKGNNVHVVGIEGNFDDAQSGVKSLFADPEMKGWLSERNMVFSSANSINIGRLVPQIVYYIYAWGRLLCAGRIRRGEKINIVVPTGNFGNILAAWYAREMGLPVERLICASNENRVLTDFFEQGVYDRNRPFLVTSSPSMDILISSNLERLIYHIAGCDPKVCAALMEELKRTGRYTITPKMRAALEPFAAGMATQEETSQEILRVFEKSGYVLDTHTAVASRVYQKYRELTGDRREAVIASTASPYKFVRSVVGALENVDSAADDLSLADRLEQISKVPVPEAVRQLKTAPVLHDLVIPSGQMKETVMQLLSGKAV